MHSSATTIGSCGSNKGFFSKPLSRRDIPLVVGLQNYEGTLILVSHDRWFVSQLATRVIEISRAGIRDYNGTYDEYVHACGDDHLDADRVRPGTRRPAAERSCLQMGSVRQKSAE